MEKTFVLFDFVSNDIMSIMMPITCLGQTCDQIVDGIPYQEMTFYADRETASISRNLLEPHIKKRITIKELISS